MAEANLIPGATQVFADVLEGGDVKKLFDKMQKGKYTLQDIVSVLDSLESKIKKSQLDQMLMRPTAELEEMRTAWVRFIEVFNKQGGLALQKAVLDEMTVMIKSLTSAIITMKPAFKAIGSILKTVYVSIKSVVGYVVALVKALSGNQLGQSVLILTGMAGVVLLLSKYVKVLNVQLMGMYVRMLAIPIAVTALVVLFIELLETLQGKDGILSALAQGDDVFSTFVAGLIMAFETVSFILKTIVGLVGGLFTGDFGFIAESFEHFKNQAMKFFPNFGNFIIEGLKSFALWTTQLVENLGARMGKMWELAKALGSFNFSKAGDIRASMGSMSLLPTAQQMNPQDYIRSLPTSAYKNVPSMLSNAPQQINNVAVTVNNPKSKFDVSQAVLEGLTNYGALQ